MSQPISKHKAKLPIYKQNENSFSSSSKSLTINMGPFQTSLPLLEKSHSNVSTASAPPSPLPDINTIEVNYWDTVDFDNIKATEKTPITSSNTSLFYAVSYSTNKTQSNQVKNTIIGENSTSPSNIRSLSPHTSETSDTDTASLSSNSSSESNTPTTKPKKRKMDELAKLKTTFLNRGNRELEELKKQKKSQSLDNK